MHLLVAGGTIGPKIRHQHPPIHQYFQHPVEVRVLCIVGVEQLVPGRVALVLPHVAPRPRRHTVAEPHMGQLVRHDRIKDERGCAEQARVVQRQRLGLQG